MLTFLSCLALLAPPAAPDKPTAPDFVTVLQRNFKAWDKDKNLMLSPLEIDAALADPQLSGDDAAAAGTIKCVARDACFRVRRVDIATIKDDLRIVQTRKPDDIFNDDWFTPDWQAAFEVARKRIRDLPHPVEEPKLSSIRVDPYGNDAFVAALGAFLIQNPNLALATVRPLPDNKVQMTAPLFARPFGPITVAQIASTSTTGNAWACAMECGIDSLNHDRFPQASYDGRIVSFEDSFVCAQNYIMLLVGKQSNITAFRTATGTRTREGWRFKALGSPEGLASTTSQILTDALKKKRMAIALSHGVAMTAANSKGPTSYGSLPPGFTTYSYVAIVSIDPKAKTITLWHPNGANFSPDGPPSLLNGYPTTGGKWTMPLNDFVLAFSGFVLEGQNDATLNGQTRGKR